MMHALAHTAACIVPLHMLYHVAKKTGMQGSERLVCGLRCVCGNEDFTINKFHLFDRVATEKGLGEEAIEHESEKYNGIDGTVTMP